MFLFCPEAETFPDNQYDYDGLDRLKSANGKWGSGNYTYDGLGNLKTRSISGSSITYHYNSVNRLNNLSGAYAYRYVYDARGNVTHNGRYSLSFNRANQLTAAKGLAYRYDGHNRRVKKQGDYSVYNQAGQLLYRQKANGEKTDTVYLGKQIIAEIDLTGSYQPPEETTPPSSNLPTLTLLVTEPNGGCPPGMLCPTAPIGQPGAYYKLSWHSTNATSCNGVIKRNNVLFRSLSGLINLGQNITNDNTNYRVEMTCTGNGEQVTKTVFFGGSGNGAEI